MVVAEETNNLWLCKSIDTYMMFQKLNDINNELRICLHIPEKLKAGF